MHRLEKFLIDKLKRYENMFKVFCLVCGSNGAIRDI